MSVFRSIELSVILVFLGAAVLAPGAWAAGDAQAGEGQSVPCAACHGKDGATGLDSSYPNLAGQNERYLTRQLVLIRDGGRDIPLMAGQLNGKSDQDLADIAAYYASLPGKFGQAQGDDEALKMAASLYRGGHLAKRIPACTSCHAPNGKGNAPAGFPNLSGQAVQYTINALTQYRERQRTSDEEYSGMMRDVAARLTDTEIAALAQYIHGLN